MKLGWLNAMLLLLMLSFQPLAVTEPQPILEWCLDDLPYHHHYPAHGQPYGPTVDFMQEIAKRANAIAAIMADNSLYHSFHPLSVSPDQP